MSVSPTKSVYGAYFEANYRDETFKYYITGKYGRFYWSHLKGINYPFVFLDIGANQGLYAVTASSNEFLVKAYAFEPVSEIAALLRRNVEINGSEGDVAVVVKAISNLRGDWAVAFDRHHSGVVTLSSETDETPSDRSEVMITSTDHIGLNGIVKERGYPVHCKVDVEGQEETVISELLKCEFAADIVEIFFEVDERWVSPESLLNRLRQAGFELEKSGNEKHYDVLARRGAALSTFAGSSGG